MAMLIMALLIMTRLIQLNMGDVSYYANTKTLPITTLLMTSINVTLHTCF
jgi:hypothetical protein